MRAVGDVGPYRGVRFPFVRRGFGPSLVLANGELPPTKYAIRNQNKYLTAAAISRGGIFVLPRKIPSLFRLSFTTLLQSAAKSVIIKQNLTKGARHAIH